MKKLFSLLLILMAVSFSVQAQTITVHVSGTVVRDSSHSPVNNHEVTIQADSNSYGFTFYATRHTNPNGFYDCTISNVPSTGTAISFTVKTKNCDSTWLAQTFVGTVSYDTANFVICNVNSHTCQAAFTFYVDSVSPHHPVYFTDQSTPADSILSWHWVFDDGTDTTINYPHNPNVSHIYLGGALSHNACLTIATTFGCSSQICHEVTTQNGDCHAHYSYLADSANLLHVHFTDISTPQNLIISRLWNFGDPLSGTNNTSTNFDPWHTYTIPGTYEVCLTIATSTGCSSTFCDSITVGTGNTSCENWFTYTSSGLTVNFEGHTHSPYPTTYYWGFDDPQSGSNNSSNLQNPTHTFSASGSYSIFLHTYDTNGCEWNRHQSIYIHSTCDLNGTGFLGDSIHVDHGLAELIKIDSGAFTTVASQEFGDSLGMYWFGGVYPGHYYIRASLLPSSAYYGQYVPTYYHDAVNWGNATLIELGQPANPYNIHMHHATNYPVGNGNISGTITQSGKYNGSGIPAANVEVLIMDLTGQVLAFTMTDANGAFTFANMGMGTYKVYPEMLLKTTIATTVILEANHPTANVVFAIKGDNISGIHDVTIQSEFAISDVYPNPVSDIANLNIQTATPAAINISLYSITGEFVVTIPVNLVTGLNKVSIPAYDLRKGLYYIKVEKPDGGVIVKKFISEK